MPSQLKQFKQRYWIISLFFLISFMSFNLLRMYLGAKMAVLFDQNEFLIALLAAISVAYSGLVIYLLTLTLVVFAAYFIAWRFKKKEARIAFLVLSIFMLFGWALFVSYYILSIQ